MTELLLIENVYKNFHMGDSIVEALKNISFSVNKGGIVALMGPSGSGKSTLLNLIGALDIQTSGLIKINGRSLLELKDDERADFRNKTVGFVFQNFNLIPVLTTIENVTLPSQIGSHKDNFEEYAKTLLIKVGLEKQINQKVNRLSGGQMQRVALARALINEPDIILADEPTANLDHVTSETVLDLMRKISNNTTIIIATHDHSVLKYCDRILTLRDGILVKDETT